MSDSKSIHPVLFCGIVVINISCCFPLSILLDPMIKGTTGKVDKALICQFKTDHEVLRVRSFLFSQEWKCLVKSVQGFRNLAIIERRQIIGEEAHNYRRDRGPIYTSNQNRWLRSCLCFFDNCWTPDNPRNVTPCSTFMLLEQGGIPSYHACCDTGPRFLRSPSKDSSI